MKKNIRKNTKPIKNFFLSILLTFIILLPYLVFAYKLGVAKLIMTGPVKAGYGEGDPQFYTIQGWLWYPKTLVKQVSLPIAVLSFSALLLLILKKEKNWKLLAIWFLSYYVLFSIIPNKDIRYILPYLPTFLFSFSYFSEKIFSERKYITIFLISMILLQGFVSFFYLPKYNYPVYQIAERVYKNSKGNVAFVSEGAIYSSAFMFHLAKLDRNRTIITYRPCVFDNKTAEEVQKFLKENNIYYLILVEKGYGYENFEKIKDIELEEEFFRAKLYVYKGFDGKGTKKCNFICLTKQEICLQNQQM